MSKVYKAISEVAKYLSEIGIKKTGKNTTQNFQFRSIDALYNALSPALVKHGLLILPRIIERNLTERQTRNGGSLFYVTVKAEFDFIATEDGSKHTVTTFGEAMDAGDKATNKAMSIAYKHAAFQAFCIPTEETAIDPDAETHQVVYKHETSADVLNEFTGKATSSKTVFELKKHFSTAWKKLEGTIEQAKAKEVYDIRKSELEELNGKPEPV
uniref:Single-stranded DNA-binding protein n=1 Tax=Arsenophonus endosymbiont of Trialeurodes vaporariorum TaxID=235567 RepID=A0A3B0MFQ1_9GAMM